MGLPAPVAPGFKGVLFIGDLLIWPRPCRPILELHKWWFQTIGFRGSNIFHGLPVICLSTSITEERQGWPQSLLKKLHGFQQIPGPAGSNGKFLLRLTFYIVSFIPQEGTYSWNCCSCSISSGQAFGCHPACQQPKNPLLPYQRCFFSSLRIKWQKSKSCKLLSAKPCFIH